MASGEQLGGFVDLFGFEELTDPATASKKAAVATKVQQQIPNPADTVGNETTVISKLEVGDKSKRSENEVVVPILFQKTGVRKYKVLARQKVEDDVVEKKETNVIGKSSVVLSKRLSEGKPKTDRDSPNSKEQRKENINTKVVVKKKTVVVERPHKLFHEKVQGNTKKTVKQPKQPKQSTSSKKVLKKVKKPAKPDEAVNVHLPVKKIVTSDVKSCDTEKTKVVVEKKKDVVATEVVPSIEHDTVPVNTISQSETENSNEKKSERVNEEKGVTIPRLKCSVKLNRDPSIESIVSGDEKKNEPEQNDEPELKANDDALSGETSDMTEEDTNGMSRQNSLTEIKVDMVYDAKNIEVRKSGRLKSAKCASRYRGDYGIRVDTYTKLVSQKGPGESADSPGSDISGYKLEDSDTSRSATPRSGVSDSEKYEYDSEDKKASMKRKRRRSKEMKEIAVCDNEEDRCQHCGGRKTSIADSRDIDIHKDNEDSNSRCSPKNLDVGCEARLAPNNGDDDQGDEPCSNCVHNDECSCKVPYENCEFHKVHICDCNPSTDVIVSKPGSSKQFDGGTQSERGTKKLKLVGKLANFNDTLSIYARKSAGYEHSVGKSVKKIENRIEAKRNVAKTEKTVETELSPNGSPSKESPNPLAVLENLRQILFEKAGADVKVADKKPKKFESKVVKSKRKTCEVVNQTKAVMASCSVIPDPCNASSTVDNDSISDKSTPRCSTPRSETTCEILEEISVSLESLQKQKQRATKKGKSRRRKFEDKKFVLRSMSKDQKTESLGDGSDSLPFESASSVTNESDDDKSSVSDDVLAKVKPLTKKISCSSDLKTENIADKKSQERKKTAAKPKPVKCQACNHMFKTRELLRKHYPCRVRQTRTWSQNKLRPHRAVKRQDPLPRKIPVSLTKAEKSDKPRPQLLLYRKTKFRRVKGKRRRRLYQAIQDLMHKRQPMKWPHLSFCFDDLSFKEQCLYRVGLMCIGKSSEGLEQYSADDITVFENHRAVGKKVADDTKLFQPCPPDPDETDEENKTEGDKLNIPGKENEHGQSTLPTLPSEDTSEAVDSALNTITETSDTNMDSTLDSFNNANTVENATSVIEKAKIDSVKPENKSNEQVNDMIKSEETSCSISDSVEKTYTEESDTPYVLKGLINTETLDTMEEMKAEESNISIKLVSAENLKMASNKVTEIFDEEQESHMQEISMSMQQDLPESIQETPVHIPEVESIIVTNISITKPVTDESDNTHVNNISVAMPVEHSYSSPNYINEDSEKSSENVQDMDRVHMIAKEEMKIEENHSNTPEYANEEPKCSNLTLPVSREDVTSQHLLENCNGIVIELVISELLTHIVETVERNSEADDYTPKKNEKDSDSDVECETKIEHERTLPQQSDHENISDVKDNVINEHLDEPDKDDQPVHIHDGTTCADVELATPVVNSKCDADETFIQLENTNNENNLENDETNTDQGHKVKDIEDVAEAQMQHVNLPFENTEVSLVKHKLKSDVPLRVSEDLNLPEGIVHTWDEKVPSLESPSVETLKSDKYIVSAEEMCLNESARESVFQHEHSEEVEAEKVVELEKCDYITEMNPDSTVKEEETPDKWMPVTVDTIKSKTAYQNSNKAKETTTVRMEETTSLVQNIEDTRANALIEVREQVEGCTADKYADEQESKTSQLQNVDYKPISLKDIEKLVSRDESFRPDRGWYRSEIVTKDAQGTNIQLKRNEWSSLPTGSRKRSKSESYNFVNDRTKENHFVESEQSSSSPRKKPKHISLSEYLQKKGMSHQRPKQRNPFSESKPDILTKKDFETSYPEIENTPSLSRHKPTKERANTSLISKASNVLKSFLSDVGSGEMDQDIANTGTKHNTVPIEKDNVKSKYDFDADAEDEYDPECNYLLYDDYEPGESYEPSKSYKPSESYEPSESIEIEEVAMQQNSVEKVKDVESDLLEKLLEACSDINSIADEQRGYCLDKGIYVKPVVVQLDIPKCPEIENKSTTVIISESVQTPSDLHPTDNVNHDEDQEEIATVEHSESDSTKDLLQDDHEEVLNDSYSDDTRDDKHVDKQERNNDTLITTVENEMEETEVEQSITETENVSYKSITESKNKENKVKQINTGIENISYKSTTESIDKEKEEDSLCKAQEEQQNTDNEHISYISTTEGEDKVEDSVCNTEVEQSDTETEISFNSTTESKDTVEEDSVPNTEVKQSYIESQDKVEEDIAYKTEVEQHGTENKNISYNTMTENKDKVEEDSVFKTEVEQHGTEKENITYNTMTENKDNVEEDSVFKTEEVMQTNVADIHSEEECFDVTDATEKGYEHETIVIEEKEDIGVSDLDQEINILKSEVQQKALSEMDCEMNDQDVLEQVKNADKPENADIPEVTTINKGSPADGSDKTKRETISYEITDCEEIGKHEIILEEEMTDEKAETNSQATENGNISSKEINESKAYVIKYEMNGLVIKENLLTGDKNLVENSSPFRTSPELDKAYTGPLSEELSQDSQNESIAEEETSNRIIEIPDLDNTSVIETSDLDNTTVTVGSSSSSDEEIDNTEIQENISDEGNETVPKPRSLFNHMQHTSETETFNEEINLCVAQTQEIEPHVSNTATPFTDTNEIASVTFFAKTKDKVTQALYPEGNVDDRNNAVEIDEEMDCLQGDESETVLAKSFTTESSPTTESSTDLYISQESKITEFSGTKDISSNEESEIEFESIIAADTSLQSPDMSIEEKWSEDVNVESVISPIATVCESKTMTSLIEVSDSIELMRSSQGVESLTLLEATSKIELHTETEPTVFKPLPVLAEIKLSELKLVPSPPVLEKVDDVTDDIELVEDTSSQGTFVSIGSDPPVLEPESIQKGEKVENVPNEMSSRKDKSERHFLDVLGSAVKSPECPDKENEITNAVACSTPVPDKKETDFNENIGRHFSDVVNSQPDKPISSLQFLLDKSEHGEVTLANIKDILSPISKQRNVVSKDSLLKIQSGIAQLLSKVKKPEKKDPSWLKRDALAKYAKGDSYDKHFRIYDSESEDEAVQYPILDDSKEKTSKKVVTDNIMEMLDTFKDKGSIADNMSKLMDILAENLGFIGSGKTQDSYSLLDSDSENEENPYPGKMTCSGKVSVSLEDNQKQMIASFLEDGEAPPALEDIPTAEDTDILNESSETVLTEEENSHVGTLFPENPPNMDEMSEEINDVMDVESIPIVDLDTHATEQNKTYQEELEPLDYQTIPADVTKPSREQSNISDELTVTKKKIDASEEVDIASDNMDYFEDLFSETVTQESKEDADMHNSNKKESNTDLLERNDDKKETFTHDQSSVSNNEEDERHIEDYGTYPLPLNAIVINKSQELINSFAGNDAEDEDQVIENVHVEDKDFVEVADITDPSNIDNVTPTDNSDVKRSKGRTIFKSITELNSIETDEESSSSDQFDHVKMSWNLSELKVKTENTDWDHASDYDAHSDLSNMNDDVANISDTHIDEPVGNVPDTIPSYLSEAESCDREDLDVTNKGETPKESIVNTEQEICKPTTDSFKDMADLQDCSSIVKRNVLKENLNERKDAREFTPSGIEIPSEDAHKESINNAMSSVDLKTFHDFYVHEEVGLQRQVESSEQESIEVIVNLPEEGQGVETLDCVEDLNSTKVNDKLLTPQVKESFNTLTDESSDSREQVTTVLDEKETEVENELLVNEKMTSGAHDNPLMPNLQKDINLVNAEFQDEESANTIEHVEDSTHIELSESGSIDDNKHLPLPKSTSPPSKPNQCDEMFQETDRELTMNENEFKSKEQHSFSAEVKEQSDDSDLPLQQDDGKAKDESKEYEKLPTAFTSEIGYIDTSCLSDDETSNTNESLSMLPLSEQEKTDTEDASQNSPENNHIATEVFDNLESELSTSDVQTDNLNGMFEKQGSTESLFNFTSFSPKKIDCLHKESKSSEEGSNDKEKQEANETVSDSQSSSPEHSETLYEDSEDQNNDYSTHDEDTDDLKEAETDRIPDLSPQDIHNNDIGGDLSRKTDDLPEPTIKSSTQESTVTGNKRKSIEETVTTDCDKTLVNHATFSQDKNVKRQRTKVKRYMELGNKDRREIGSNDRQEVTGARNRRIGAADMINSDTKPSSQDYQSVITADDYLFCESIAEKVKRKQRERARPLTYNPWQLLDEAFEPDQRQPRKEISIFRSSILEKRAREKSIPKEQPHEQLVTPKSRSPSVHKEYQKAARRNSSTRINNLDCIKGCSIKLTKLSEDIIHRYTCRKRKLLEDSEPVNRPPIKVKINLSKIYMPPNSPYGSTSVSSDTNRSGYESESESSEVETDMDNNYMPDQASEVIDNVTPVVQPIREPIRIKMSTLLTKMTTCKESENSSTEASESTSYSSTLKARSENKQLGNDVLDDSGDFQRDNHIKFYISDPESVASRKTENFERASAKSMDINAEFSDAFDSDVDCDMSPSIAETQKKVEDIINASSDLSDFEVRLEPKHHSSSDTLETFTHPVLVEPVLKESASKIMNLVKTDIQLSESDSDDGTEEAPWIKLPLTNRSKNEKTVTENEKCHNLVERTLTDINSSSISTDDILKTGTSEPFDMDTACDIDDMQEVVSQTIDITANSRVVEDQVHISAVNSLQLDTFTNTHCSMDTSENDMYYAVEAANFDEVQEAVDNLEAVGVVTAPVIVENDQECLFEVVETNLPSVLDNSEQGQVKIPKQDLYHHQQNLLPSQDEFDGSPDNIPELLQSKSKYLYGITEDSQSSADVLEELITDNIGPSDSMTSNTLIQPTGPTDDLSTVLEDFEVPEAIVTDNVIDTSPDNCGYDMDTCALDLTSDLGMFTNI